ncbi:questin oxidase family protein [Plantactinospora sp. GCM10030261]|uniref:questin oxidase family protein n=1 Tax=Plantactinospora sp. GCM10030261 TaxID=3273420 RepID=UPI00361BE0B3
MTNFVLDEAYERLVGTGPERNGWLSNHAPMAVEALVHHGRTMAVHRWIDGYADRLEERPRGIAPIERDEWRDPLGDPLRTGDWLRYFERELAAEPWQAVLTRWWPRLLPGIAAGATHGVIRVGHAVRALLDAETAPRVAELGQGLAYWAARWQPLAPVGAGPYPVRDPRSALDAVPRVPDQRYGIRARLAQLAALPGWPEAAGAVPGVSTAPTVALAAIVDAATERFGTHGYGAPIMMVHSVTAPNAVLRTLPALPSALWPASVAAAWAATAAVTAAYAPGAGRSAAPAPHPTGQPVDTGQPPNGGVDAGRPVAAGGLISARPSMALDDVVDRAVATGDPHAIKFVDTAMDTYRRTGDSTVVAIANRSIDLISAD